MNNNRPKLSLMELKEKMLASVRDESKSLDKRFMTASKIFDGGVKEAESIAPTKQSLVSKSYTLTTDEIKQVESIVLEFAHKGMLINRSEVVRMGLASLIMQDDDKYNILDKIVRMKSMSKPKP